MISTIAAAVRGQSGVNPPIAVPPGHLAAGDDVIVTVFQEKELSGRVYVDGQNQIVLPRLGVLSVSELTTDMLRDSVRARYATFLREPSVDVRVLRRVTVNGAVLKPDVYFVDPSMTLRDVVARAGGVTSEGDMHKVYIVRGPTPTVYPEWSTGPQGQTEMRSGDEVMVARRSWAFLNMGALIGAAGLLTSLGIALFHR